jgi:hypothetical protein
VDLKPRIAFKGKAPDDENHRIFDGKKSESNGCGAPLFRKIRRGMPLCGKGRPRVFARVLKPYQKFHLNLRHAWFKGRKVCFSGLPTNS